MIPTYNRPDMLRHCVLQMLAQTRRPDVICVYENGLPGNYRWCVEDIEFPIIWLHTPHREPNYEFYLRPLLFLIGEGCTHFFRVDHDDLYLRNHIEVSLGELLAGRDFRISNHCGVLIVPSDSGRRSYEYYDGVRFEFHAPKGMSSSIAFNRSFAVMLAEQLPLHSEYVDFDEIVARVVAPFFSCHWSSIKTTVYVSHVGAATSGHWVGLAGKLPPFAQG
ncbi:glycosyltransferase family 2 protein [Paraburkholderia humisilvae]|nr:hypothetical protein [Paraburkholderia humisilvae]